MSRGGKSNWPRRVWIGLFCIWLLFLSGAPGELIGGSPGAYQLLRLHQLLNNRKAQAESIQNEIRRLEMESSLLETNKAVQQREIRRILGYAAPDELIFDFSSN